MIFISIKCIFDQQTNELVSPYNELRVITHREFSWLLKAELQKVGVQGSSSVPLQVPPGHHQCHQGIRHHTQDYCRCDHIGGTGSGSSRELLSAHHCCCSTDFKDIKIVGLGALI